MFIWRTRNVTCLQYIPAELEAVTEDVYEVKADSNIVLFKVDHVRLKNKEYVMF